MSTMNEPRADRIEAEIGMTIHRDRQEAPAIPVYLGGSMTWVEARSRGIPRTAVEADAADNQRDNQAVSKTLPERRP